MNIEGPYGQVRTRCDVFRQGEQCEQHIHTMGLHRLQFFRRRLATLQPHHREIAEHGGKVLRFGGAVDDELIEPRAQGLAHATRRWCTVVYIGHGQHTEPHPLLLGQVPQTLRLPMG